MPLNSPSDPSIRTLINCCKTIRHLYQLHARIIRKGLEQDHFIVSHLLSHSSSISYSASIFDRVISPSTILYNILVKIYAHNYHFQETISLFIHMKRSSEHSWPDKYTYPSLIRVFSSEFRLKEGGIVHGSAIRCGVSDDVYVGSSLVDFYGKCKEILSARKMFDEMTQKNVVSWTAMVVGYLNVGDLGNAERLFDQMPERNLKSWNAMIDGWVKAGDLLLARKVFDEMPERNVVSFTVMIDGYAKAGDMTTARDLFERAPKRDVIAWSALISGYAQNGQPNEAVRIFLEMESKNVKPDEYIMVSLMSACSQLGSLDLARWADCYLSKSSIDIGQTHVIAALIDMNAKCGNMERAKKLFEEMPKRDLITYCSMIQGLSIHGCAEQAVGLFNRMLNESLIPDEAAFTVVLTACSRGGLVDEGRHYFETMKSKYFMLPSPDHYACIIDLLSRSGQLKEAYELLKLMPVEPPASAWGALLGACKLYGEVELGEVVANRLFELEPENSGPYVLLSSIYAGADQWGDVSLVREKMKESGVRKIPGRSWI
ncbi:putative pentatricopeptide repeat-containing protein At5g37570 [Ricinus communis]|uniref:putative pentatricopeptide repeat-containing protein At5g37570 n=1 Tax=Ricinus communis TaxID=3988 RepID=UPI0007727618|nr:putative pentatricopeptide repeat-containing protein At5g37570 [Ricinus communis]|eukprot:XP_015581682.1 putative pentatricopeptide repeat-containing protein At5g37570 [Ricinus communis]